MFEGVLPSNMKGVRFLKQIKGLKKALPRSLLPGSA